MVAIVIICYNLDARVFLLQVDAIKKFCKDEFEIHVFDNSTNLEQAEGIRYHCDIRAISYKKTQSASKNGSESHSFAANLAFELLKNKFAYYFFIDHDCIPVKPFSVPEILGVKVIAGLGQQGLKKYFWPGAVMFNAMSIDQSIVDFKYSHEFRGDTGCGLYKIIEKYGEENCLFFNEAYCELEGFDGKMAYYSLINNGMLLHFVGGSNWEKNDRHDERVNKLISMTEELIKNVD